MTHTAYLGTGLLGGALAEAAAKRGDEVVAWNRTAAKARALERFGVRVAATPSDAVRGVSIVHLVLKDDAVVEDVVAQLRPGLASDTIIVDHTTTQPSLTAARAERLNAEGVKYLHCPVFIGPAAARLGRGTVLASGPRQLFDAVKGELSRMAPKVEYLGDRPDLAAVYKLCGNAFIIGVNAVTADVLAVATAAEVNGEDALRVVELFDVAGIVGGRGKNMTQRDFTPGFELEMARKDLRLMIETADRRPMATLPAIAKRMDALIDSGHGREDLSVIGKDSIG